MTTLTVQYPDSERQGIEALAAREGFSVRQFHASAASEKLAVMHTMAYLRREDETGRREDFERYLDSVPAAAPALGDELP
jgi:hypothetical protein